MFLSSFEELSIKGAWNYNMPFGTSQSPYRLSDFIGYNTEDYSYQDPIRFSTGIRDTIYLDQTYYLRFYFGYEPINPSTKSISSFVGSSLDSSSNIKATFLCHLFTTKV